MKIAIQGHPTRGKEVIQILEDLGGINRMKHKGRYDKYFYYISDDDNTITWTCIRPQHMNVFTLEEFEKEFPFKVGDKVITTDGIIGVIDRINLKDTHPYVIKTDVGDFYWCETSILKLYKEMKEERNITLNLDKAKEWYKKGGELKEIALQAYSEEELNKAELPKTWEEYCDNYPVKETEAMIGCNCRIINCELIKGKRSYRFKDVMTSKQSAKAHLALMQLEQLRDCYRGLFVTVIGMPVWCIIRYKETLLIVPRTWGTNETFLSFQSPEIAKEYLNNFKPLIKQAGDLI